MPSEYEDKYLLLRDENTALKKKKNDQEATIKRMYTKLAIIEEKLAKTRPHEVGNNQDDPATGGNKTAVLPVRRDLDAEKFITALKGENTALRKKNQVLMEKNRWLQEQCRQSGVVKRLGGAASSARPVVQKRKASRSTAVTNTSFAGSTIGNQVESARKLHRDTFSGDLEMALKKRLVIAEKQLVKLQKENEQLRTDTTRHQMKQKRDNNDEGGPSDEEDEGKHDKELSSLELDQIKRDLRDRQAQLAILNARYENLESNALAEREIQEKTLGQMEQMNRQIHKLRTQLQDTSMEKEELEVRLLKAGDQEKDITLLREQNRRLEERMTALCESPFINDAFQRKERIDKLFALEKLTQEQKTSIAQMNEENQKLQAVIRELQNSIKQLKQAKDRVEQDLAQMAHHLMEERNARSLESIKSTTGRVTTFVPQTEPLVIVRPPESQHKLPEKRDACSSPVHNNKSPGKGSVASFNVYGTPFQRLLNQLN
ncbi:hypothetical protein P3T76_000008 [Phytophthora citrophthora]|uniref:Uncharacterized protein n=1 Tax=Phytophthora citrophthora TaxID=4793 RepID=A0AAD9H0W9_9STRA|nr:hypothetical protein P3T76_000008 [Phytophthora citrophthora]